MNIFFRKTEAKGLKLNAVYIKLVIQHLKCVQNREHFDLIREMLDQRITGDYVKML